jgi:septum formation protein
MQIVLASASPRRKKLLKHLGLKFKTTPSFIKENTSEFKNLSPEQKALNLAFKKTRKVQLLLNDEGRVESIDKANKPNMSKDFLIIGADTIVVLGEQILGKPKTRIEAENMLTKLKGKQHKVITAVSLIGSQKTLRFYDTSFVLFKNFLKKDLEGYLDNNKYLDKAGAYGIQDLGKNMLKSYKGSFTNILGLPLEKLTAVLKKFNVKINKDIKINF